MNNEALDDARNQSALAQSLTGGQAYGFRAPDRTMELRIWAFERVQQNPQMNGWDVTKQIIEADRIVAWLKGESDGGQKTPDRAAA